MNISKSEMDGLLALAAKQPLRGDRRTDAKAGTIHGPTASRLLAKGLVSKHGVDGASVGYRLTAEGRAELPGAETLAATKEPEPVYPDRAPAVLVPASELPDAWKPFDKAAEDAQRKVSKALRVPSPMVNGKSKSPSDVDAPNLVKAALQLGILEHVVIRDRAPIEPPPVLRPSEPPKPAEPVQKLRHTVVNTDAFEALCTTGSVVVELPDGRARVNAIGKPGSGNYEFWISRAKAAGWARLYLGDAITTLDGVKVLDTGPMPGKLPFAPIPPNEREAIA